MRHRLSVNGRNSTDSVNREGRVLSGGFGEANRQKATEEDLPFFVGTGDWYQFVGKVVAHPADLPELLRLAKKPKLDVIKPGAGAQPLHETLPRKPPHPDHAGNNV